MQGAYILVMAVKEKIDVLIGQLGKIGFKRGYYYYIGSAMGKLGSSTLENRIMRHISMARQKKKHWHIDYFLDDKQVSIIKLFLIPHKQKLECLLAQELLDNSDGFIERFGSSDCNCKSHLLYFKNIL